jgi:hypothetical protein
MLVPDTVLQGRYRIVRQLGQGGMGAVYEAIDERLDATVALKETFFADERLRKQFEREARLLARMHHPALPRVSDHFSEGEGQFLVMQFVTGEDLAHMLTVKQGPFPADQVLTWGDQLLDALDYLHTQDPQIIHRDIKPQNLKLTSRGQMILLDFGLAKGQASAVSVVTTSASIFGYTPNYAPLEQIQGLGTDPRSDIYALGATLYHLMTGVKPPDALTRAAALVNGQPDPLAPANEINPTIGPQVAAVLARAMSQNRDQRYSTAAEMRAALSGTGEAATLIGRAEAATVILPTPSPTLAGAPPQEARATAVQAGETTVVRPRERKGWALPAGIAAAAVVLICGLVGGFYAYQHRSGATPAPEAKDQTNAPAQPSATPNDNATQPSTGALKDEKVAETSTPTSEPVKKSSQAAKPVEKVIIKRSGTSVEAPAVNPTPPKVAERYFDFQKIPAQPKVPEVGDPESPDIRRHRQLPTGVGIRTLPDGTQVFTTPNGTRMVVRPDGERRVFRPAQRPLRRKNMP